MFFGHFFSWRSLAIVCSHTPLPSCYPLAITLDLHLICPPSSPFNRAYPSTLPCPPAPEQRPLSLYLYLSIYIYIYPHHHLTQPNTHFIWTLATHDNWTEPLYVNWVGHWARHCHVQSLMCPSLKSLRLSEPWKHLVTLHSDQMLDRSGKRDWQSCTESVQEPEEDTGEAMPREVASGNSQTHRPSSQMGNLMAFPLSLPG